MNLYIDAKVHVVSLHQTVVASRRLHLQVSVDVGPPLARPTLPLYSQKFG